MRKYCPVCHQPFETRYPKSVFCSKPCKGLASRVQATVQCDGCGKTFEKYPYLVRPTNYCSLRCYHQSTNLKVETNCIKCQKMFLVKKYSVDHGHGQYCSRACQHLDYPQQVRIICKQCGGKFAKPPSVAKLTHYCSKACQDLGMSEFEIHTCAQCKKQFKIPMWEVRNGKGKFCTRECFIKFNGESSLEEKVRKYLESKQIPFQQEVKFGRYRADFLLTGTKTIIECDGEFWHLRPQSKIRDKKKDEYLHNLGYQVFRLTGRQINEHFEESINSLPLTNQFISAPPRVLVQPR